MKINKINATTNKVEQTFNSFEDALQSTKYSKSSLDKALRNKSILGQARWEYVEIKPYLGGDPNNVLVIGDTHLPFVRKGYLEHCMEVQRRFNCGTVVHIGDLLDNHYSSYHETDPDGKSAKDELDLAKELLVDWKKAFPEVKICIGNHDSLPTTRKAKSAGISSAWLRSYSEVLDLPGWDFQITHEVNGVLYIHGTGSSGDKAAMNRALNFRKSVVQGHIHTVANVNWNVSEIDKVFAMQVGCGIDDKTYAMEYARFNTKKSVISCGVVIDGKLPIVVPMEL